MEDISERAGEAAGTVSEQAKAAPAALRERAGGNPMAAGLVALGAGFLVANLLPPTDRERQAAERLRNQMEPLKQQAGDIGKEVAGELQQSAQARAEQVKERASDAVQQVKEEAQDSSEDVKEHAQAATSQVKQQGRRASRRVKQTAKEGDGPALVGHPPGGPHPAPAGEGVGLAPTRSHRRLVWPPLSVEGQTR